MQRGRASSRKPRRAPLLATTLALAMFAVIPLARAQSAPPAAKPAIAAASVRWVCTGFCKGVPRGGFVNDPMRYSCGQCIVESLIQSVYDIKFPSQIHGGATWLAWDQYAVQIAPASPVSRDQMIHVLLPQVLAQCFSLRARETTSTVPGYALIVAPGGIKFPKAEKQVFRPGGNGIFHLPNPAGVASFMTSDYYAGKIFGVTRPVSDATGLKGFYDIPFPANPPKGTNVLAAIRKLGLEVKPAPYPMPSVQIEHIAHLRTHCELGPQPAQ